MTETPDPSLVERLLAGDVGALARAISLVEEESPAADGLLTAVHARAGRACLLGITGPPGVGKSSLVDRLVSEYRRRMRRVAVLAVDPSSPFSGGAILGDRVRMQGHASDKGVFVRSMATRGHLGGLARATADASVLLDAAGFDIVIVETVGVGQDEVDIVRLADACVVVAAPGAGDDIQAIKAGLMEIADIFVVNKSDRDGADRTEAALEEMLALKDRPSHAWRVPVLRTVATTGEGVTDLLDAVERYCVVGRDALAVRRRGRTDWRVRTLVANNVLRALNTEIASSGAWDAAIDRVASGQMTAQDMATAWLDRLSRQAAGGLEHIGLAVHDEAASVAFFGDVLGFRVGAAEEVSDQGVRVRFLETRGARLELIQAVSEDSAIAKFLVNRGPGLHHIAIHVPDLGLMLARLQARGVRLIDQVPRAGANGTRVAFVHPAATGGVLVEFVETVGQSDAHR